MLFCKAQYDLMCVECAFEVFISQPALKIKQGNHCWQILPTVHHSLWVHVPTGLYWHTRIYTEVIAVNDFNQFFQSYFGCIGTLPLGEPFFNN